MEDDKKKEKGKDSSKGIMAAAGISYPISAGLMAAAKFAKKQREISKRRQKALVGASQKQSANMLGSAYKTAGLMQNLRPIA